MSYVCGIVGGYRWPSGPRRRALDHHGRAALHSGFRRPADRGAGLPAPARRGVPAVTLRPPERARKRGFARPLTGRGAGAPLRADRLEYDVFAVSDESTSPRICSRPEHGVAILDASASPVRIERLAERCGRQFRSGPHRRGQASTIRARSPHRITNGTVYRFLHKPVSGTARAAVCRPRPGAGAGRAGELGYCHGGTAHSRERPGAGANMLVLGGAALAAIGLLGAGCSCTDPTANR